MINAKKVLLLNSFLWVSLLSFSQSIPIYETDFDSLKFEAIRMFGDFRDFHESFFQVPKGWFDKDCGKSRDELIRIWEKKVKPRAYKDFLNPNLYTKDGLVFIERNGTTWRDTNIFPDVFSTFLLSYIDEFNQQHINNLCKRNIDVTGQDKYFTKQIRFDSIGLPISFNKEVGNFLPIFYSSIKTRPNGQRKAFKRILIIKIEKLNGSWLLKFHHIFNSVTDWKEHFNVEQIPILKADSYITITGGSGVDSSNYFLNPSSFVINSEFDSPVEIEWNVFDEEGVAILPVWVKEETIIGDNRVFLDDWEYLMTRSYKQWHEKREFPKWRLIARLLDGSKGDTLDVVFADPIAVKVQNKFMRKNDENLGFFQGTLYPYAEYFSGKKNTRTNLAFYFSEYFNDSSLISIVVSHKISSEEIILNKSLLESLDYKVKDDFYEKNAILSDSLTGPVVRITFNQNQLFSDSRRWKNTDHFSLPIIWNSDRYEQRIDRYNVDFNNQFYKQPKVSNAIGRFYLSVYQRGKRMLELPLKVGRVEKDMLQSIDDSILDIKKIESIPILFRSTLSSQVTFFGLIEYKGKRVSKIFELQQSSDSSLVITKNTINRIKFDLTKRNWANREYVLRIFPEPHYQRDIDQVQVPINFGTTPGTVRVGRIQVSTATSGRGEKAKLVFSFSVNQENAFNEGGMIKVKQFYLGNDSATPTDYDSAYYDLQFGERIYRKKGVRFISRMNFLLRILKFKTQRPRISHKFKYRKGDYSYQRFKFVLEYVNDWNEGTGLFEQNENITHIAYIDPYIWERSIFPYEPLFNGRNPKKRRHY